MSGEAVAVVSAAPFAGCALCAAIDASADEVGPEAWRVAYVDEVLVTLVPPDGAAVVVAPRAHVGTLSTSPELAGGVLAGLRRAILAVKTFYCASGAMVQPIDDMPGSGGHVCYRIVPTPPSLPGAAEPARIQPHELATGLSGYLALAMRPPEGATRSEQLPPEAPAS